MKSVKDAKFLVVLAALGLGLAGCEQREAETSGDSEAGSGAMNPPGTLGPQGNSEKADSSTEGRSSTGY